MTTSRIRPLLIANLLAKLWGSSTAPSIDTDPLATYVGPLVWVRRDRLSTAKMSAFATESDRRDLEYFRQKSGHRPPDWAAPFASPDEGGAPRHETAPGLRMRGPNAPMTSLRAVGGMRSPPGGAAERRASIPHPHRNAS